MLFCLLRTGLLMHSLHYLACHVKFWLRVEYALPFFGFCNMSIHSYWFFMSQSKLRLDFMKTKLHRVLSHTVFSIILHQHQKCLLLYMKLNVQNVNEKDFNFLMNLVNLHRKLSKSTECCKWKNRNSSWEFCNKLTVELTANWNLLGYINWTWEHYYFSFHLPA